MRWKGGVYGGASIQWLRDEMKLISDAFDSNISPPK
jgi:glycerol kinase